jgi:hypothetical protein
MKTTLAKSSRSLVLAVLFIALNSCEDDPAPNHILFSSFESDALGGVPNKALPGNPVGDELMYNAETNMEIVPMDGAPSYKSLKLPQNEEISFVSKQVSLTSSNFTVSWSGQMGDHMSAHTYSGRKYFILHDGTHILFKILIFGGAVVAKFANNDGDYFEGESFGIVFPEYYPHDGYPNGSKQQHTFIVKVKYPGKTYDVTIVGPDLVGGGTVVKTNIPFYHTNATTSPARLYLQVQNVDDSGMGYTINEATMTQQFVRLNPNF